MTGILLIHGAWHGPWCWDGFGARLAERGHDVRTVRLRGHEQSGERIWHRIHHYVEDVHRAAERFAEPPVLVLGASDDAIISVNDVRRTARAYDTQAELFEGTGHDMTLGTGWERVADRVDAWVCRVRPRPKVDLALAATASLPLRRRWLRPGR